MSKLATRLFLSLFIAAALTAILFFAKQVFGVPFPAYDLMALLIRELPGGIITFGIDRMGDIILELNIARIDRAAKVAEELSAVATFLGVVTVVGFVYALFADRLHRAGRYLATEWATGLGLGLLVGAIFAAISAEYNFTAETSSAVSTGWILLSLVAWGFGINWVMHQLLRREPKPATQESTPAQAASIETTTPSGESASLNVLDRRQFLLQIGGASAAITLAGTGLGFLLEDDDTLLVTAGNVNVEDLLANGQMPAPGTRPEYTPLSEHYRIDISLDPPNLDEESWALKIGGLVDGEQEFTLAQLREYDELHQFITIGCISNRIAGDLISTTRWTGFSMRDLLADINYQDSATHIRISAADGFFEIVEIQEILDDPRVMLAYEWDGVPLLPKHGFPLRIYLPNRYGMKQPKWITEFEFIDGWEEGYWVTRGWDADALVKTTSVIDTIAVDSAYEEGDNLMVPIGGIAWAGSRGISRVEVRVDDGEWQEAELRDPLSELTWVVWRFDWPFQEGGHTITVRAFEGDGTQQIEERASQRPSGATGFHNEFKEFELG